LLSLFPLFIYASTQISSITLQVFLTILFFFYFFKLLKKNNITIIFLFSLISGLLILLRGEFILIFALSNLYLFFFFKIKLNKILLILFITLITISPYLFRNVLLFDTVTITKSFGYNLWKGNNPSAKVEGSVIHNKNLEKKIQNLPNGKFYAFNLDKIYLDEAMQNIKEDPKKYIALFFKKFASIILIDIKSSDPNYYNFFHYFPLLLLGVISLFGIILSNKKSEKFNYLILIYFTTIIIFSFFFVLPRYKLVILPLQLIFANIFFEYINKRFFKS
jgi:hypothetical protein